MESKVVTKDILWMELDEWTFESCTAHFGAYEESMVLYDIQSKEESKWHATTLLRDAFQYYTNLELEVIWTAPLNSRMESLYQKVWIPYFA